MEASSVYVKSEELVNLQTSINQLASKLEETYSFVCQSMKTVHEFWQDCQFDEFEENFRSRQDKIQEISERYHEFATKYLPPFIDKTAENERRKMNIR